MNTATAIATSTLIIRSTPSKSATDIGRVAQWDGVQVVDGSQTFGYIQLADRPGWIAYAYLSMGLVKRTTYVVVGTTELRKRSGPSTAYAILGLIPAGTAVDVLLGSSQGVFIKLADGLGWVSTDYLGEVEPPNGIATKYVSSTAGDKLDVYSAPDKTSSVIGALQPGAAVKVYIPSVNGWYRLVEE